ncbi:(E2-independent) E3 ubiquitin-conjugating enzyme FATS [Dromaius novaehollandiae]|uniref:(E2-independent) E3 ubiquitin-conjugating enzyme FATS n=1 Tax=Dromaius novaehollandiae TaxID=8790 RepID=UPI00311EA3E5
MPSGEGRPAVLCCARPSPVDFKDKPCAGWTQDAQSFVTQVYFTINSCSWKKTCCFAVTQKHWGSSSHRTFTGLQRENAAEGNSSSTKESPASQNAKLISPMVISQVTDENKSKENGSALPAYVGAYPRKQSVADHGSVEVHSAFTLLPGRLRIQASLDGAVARPGSRVAEEDRCPNQQRGFASITVTARRVGGPWSAPALGAQPRGDGDTRANVNAAPTTLSKAGPAPQGTPLPSQGSRANRNVADLKVSESCSWLREEPPDRLCNSANKESRGVLRGSGRREEVPPSFTSCVHLRVSPQCPNTIYYLDKSLHVRIDQPQIECQKVHRSALSFPVNCSSSRLTADGVDGIANGEPLAEMLKSKLLGENKTPLRESWSADLVENNVIKKQTTDEGYLGTKCPFKSVFLSQLPAFVATPKGPNNVIAIKKEDNKECGSNRTTFSIQLPSPSYEAGTGMFSGSNTKQRATGEGCTAAPASCLHPASASDGPSAGRDPSRGTSEAKESPPPSFLKPKVSLSDSMCNTKTLSRIVLEANVHGQNQFLKGDYKFCGSNDKIKEPKERAEQEGASGVTLSAAHLPDVAPEKKDALPRPGICSEPEKIPPSPLTLREALEIHKPQFISRSRERLKKLEHMVQLRKAQHSDAPGRKQGALLVRKLSSTSFSSKKRQYTIPHPLSDNLFKPKERFIPEKEMHMRSKRIYDNLPEVKKKQEEKQKRVIIQSNRLRVEIFKKQLLDQLLQRNTE